ncbi:MAG: methyltransferase domain-containing protein [Phycisphaerales bacterium]|nr:methyltransferase domain-containing protein [Phycisphaerales bacterium]
MTVAAAVSPTSIVAERPTANAVSAGVDARLADHRHVWRRKPLLRDIYREFFAAVRARLAELDGPIVEIGGGPGCFKEYQQGLDRTRPILSFDVTPCPWLDFAADACDLPLKRASVGSLVMIDVLHHLAYPQRFFESAVRVLKPGGRMVMIEPYVSPASWPVYKFIHPEPVDGRVRPLEMPADQPVNDPARAWDSNSAIPTVLFWRDKWRFEARFPDLRIVERRRMSFLLYPLSGGFGFPSLIPSWAVAAVERVESWLAPFGRWLAFRCLVTVEKR